MFVARAESQPAFDKRFEYTARHMGVVARIVLYAADEASAKSVASVGFTRIAELEDIFSNYRPDSEISRLARASAGSPRVVSPELLRVLRHVDVLWTESGGAFDPTIGPLADLWRTSRTQGTLPSRELISKAKSLVGWRFVQIDTSSATVTLARSDMSIDLGAAVKGFAADEALRVMRRMGYRRALVELGGDIVVGDAPPGTDAWTIDGSRFGGVDRIEIKNGAVSTSGDSQQHLEIEGTRYSHILDPRTGVGLTDSAVVTVVAKDGLTADGLATTISVMGEKAGRALAERVFPGTRVYVRQM